MCFRQSCRGESSVREAGQTEMAEGAGQKGLPLAAGLMWGFSAREEKRGGGMSHLSLSLPTFPERHGKGRRHHALTFYTRWRVALSRERRSPWLASHSTWAGTG